MLIPVVDTILFGGVIALGYFGYRYPDKIGRFFFAWSYTHFRDKGGRQFVRWGSLLLGFIGIFLLFASLLIAFGSDS